MLFTFICVKLKFLSEKIKIFILLLNRLGDDLEENAGVNKSQIRTQC